MLNTSESICPQHKTWLTAEAEDIPSDSHPSAHQDNLCICLPLNSVHPGVDWHNRAFTRGLDPKANERMEKVTLEMMWFFCINDANNHYQTHHYSVY